MKLSELKPNKGSRKKRLRVGRGESSGHGKTCGRGGKGQKGRKGAKIRDGFEGGQMPLYRRLPKIGFFSRKKTLGVNEFVAVNLAALDRFQAGSVVDGELLAQAGLVSRNQRVKVLAKGEITRKLTVKVNAISGAARQKIEAAGGTVELI